MKTISGIDQPLLFAHRGASIEFPENSMAAFERAVELGVDVIETDAHITADGHVVLCHDETGERLASEPKAVADSSLGDVQSWDIGFNHGAAENERPFASQGHCIPTLSEALSAFPEMRWNIDIKVEGSDAASHVAEQIRKLGAEQRVLLASFSARTLKDIRNQGYLGETGMGRADVVQMATVPRFIMKGVPPFCPGGHRVQVPIRSGPFLFASKSFVEKCHRLDKAVDFWTINTESETKMLLELGVDGIMTDDPRMVKALFDDLFE
jgi:glycerophosphoryl diester phosphodiesterase